MPALAEIEQIAAVIPHLVEAATTLTNWLDNSDLITPFSSIANFYEGQAAYEVALAWAQQCLNTVEARLGKDHPATAVSLNNFSNAL